MFTYFVIASVLCSIAFILGTGYGRRKEYHTAAQVIQQKEASIQEMLEVIDKQGATINEYSDMSPAEHIRVANNMLKAERKIMPPCTYNEELRAARSMASRVMRQHLEPEV